MWNETIDECHEIYHHHIDHFDVKVLIVMAELQQPVVSNGLKESHQLRHLRGLIKALEHCFYPRRHYEWLIRSVIFENSS